MRAALVVALLVSAAGCIKGEPPGPAKLDAANESARLNDTTTPVGTSVSAFNETNRTETSGIGSMKHEHDYWGGKERVEIWTETATLIPLPLIPCKRPGCNADSPAGDDDNLPLGTAIADFDIPAPPAGGLVFEGTDHLEVVFKDVTIFPFPDGAPAHPFVHIGLDYLTAADEPYHFRSGPEIVPGKAAIIPVAPLDADMPHQTKSLWVFRIYTHEANAFSFNVTVTAVKGHAVANWPPHPDLYADRPERVVFDGDVTYETKGAAQSLIDGSDVGWTYPDKVISWGTDKIVVEITGVAFSQPVPAAPDSFELQYHNASYVSKVGNGDPAGGHLQDEGTDGTTWRFEAPVDAQAYDTPYGQASRWGFRFAPVWAQSADAVLPFSVSYHMRVVAYGRSIDGATTEVANEDPTKS